jgi:hypothetical protein
MALSGHRLPLLLPWQQGARVDVCCASPEPAPHGTMRRHCSWRLQRTVGGHRDVARSRRTDREVAALIAHAVSAPQYGVGAATLVGHPHTASKTAHVAKGQVRQQQESGKKTTNPLSAGVYPLTTGGLIRVMRHCRTTRFESDLGPLQSLSCCRVSSHDRDVST